MPDLLTLARAASAEAQALVADVESLDDADWERPTRCAGWTVEDLVRHLAVVDGLAGALEDLAAGRPARIGAASPAEGDREAAAGGVRRGARHLVEAVSGLDAGLAETASSEGMPATALVGLAAVEVAVHRNDLRWALGTPEPLPAVAAEQGVGMAAMLAGYAVRGQEQPERAVTIRLQGATCAVTLRWDGTRWAPGDPEEPPDATVAGDDSAVALFVFGRIPAGHPSLRVDGDARLAERFKEYIPGP